MMISIIPSNITASPPSYDPQIAVFGRTMQHRLASLQLFLVRGWVCRKGEQGVILTADHGFMYGPLTSPAPSSVTPA